MKSQVEKRNLKGFNKEKNLETRQQKSEITRKIFEVEVKIFPISLFHFYGKKIFKKKFSRKNFFVEKMKLLFQFSDFIFPFNLINHAH